LKSEIDGQQHYRQHGREPCEGIDERDIGPQKWTKMLQKQPEITLLWAAIVM
jgi:hypothetical protein